MNNSLSGFYLSSQLLFPFFHSHRGNYLCYLNTPYTSSSIQFYCPEKTWRAPRNVVGPAGPSWVKSKQRCSRASVVLKRSIDDSIRQRFRQCSNLFLKYNTGKSFVLFISLKSKVMWGKVVWSTAIALSNSIQLPIGCSSSFRKDSWCWVRGSSGWQSYKFVFYGSVRRCKKTQAGLLK